MVNAIDISNLKSFRRVSEMKRRHFRYKSISTVYGSNSLEIFVYILVSVARTSEDTFLHLKKKILFSGL